MVALARAGASTARIWVQQAHAPVSNPRFAFRFFHQQESRSHRSSLHTSAASWQQQQQQQGDGSGTDASDVGKRLEAGAALRPYRTVVPAADRLIVIGDVHGDVGEYSTHRCCPNMYESLEPRIKSECSSTRSPREFPVAPSAEVRSLHGTLDSSTLGNFAPEIMRSGRMRCASLCRENIQQSRSQGPRDTMTVIFTFFWSSNDYLLFQCRTDVYPWTARCTIDTISARIGMVSSTYVRAVSSGRSNSPGDFFVRRDTSDTCDRSRDTCGTLFASITL